MNKFLKKLGNLTNHFHILIVGISCFFLIATYLHQLQSEQDLAQMADITEI